MARVDEVAPIFDVTVEGRPTDVRRDDCPGRQSRESREDQHHAGPIRAPPPHRPSLPRRTTPFTCRAGCKEHDVSEYRNAGPVKCNCWILLMASMETSRRLVPSKTR